MFTNVQHVVRVYVCMYLCVYACMYVYVCLYECIYVCMYYCRLRNFMLKIIRVENIRVDKFLWFHLILEIFCVKCFICVLNFRSWSQPQNYFNSEIYPIYGMFVCMYIIWYNVCIYIIMIQCMYVYNYDIMYVYIYIILI